MVTVTQTIHIDAPVEDVFAYLDDPHNHVEVTPSLASVKNVERLENGGKRLDHTFRMAGVEIGGELVEKHRSENEVMLFDMRGNLEGEIELRFEAEDDGTRFSYTARYDLPGKVLSVAAEPFVRRYNERELKTTLENVKTRLELAEA
ncbi:MAG: SRPBCC family protein [Natronomonas sp.]